MRKVINGIWLLIIFIGACISYFYDKTITTGELYIIFLIGMVYMELASEDEW